MTAAKQAQRTPGPQRGVKAAYRAGRKDAVESLLPTIRDLLMLADERAASLPEWSAMRQDALVRTQNARAAIAKAEA
jgi:hypothetical protein